jgi:hypothetical protein
MDKIKFPHEIADGVDPALPGIYLWLIAGAVVYVGKYTHSRRPLKAYARNVARLLRGLPYHIKGGDYRAIHKALAEAVRSGAPVIVRLVENVLDPAARSARETALIAEHRAVGLAVCNATP